MKFPASHRLIALSILTALLLASCGGSAGGADTTAPLDTTSAPETEPANPYGDGLPQTMDFDGYNFRVLTFVNGNTVGHGNWRCYIDVAEQNGELLNDAAYTRNMEVEDRLNVNVTCIEEGAFGLTYPFVEQSALAGDDAFDFVVFSSNDKMTSLVGSGCLYDVNTLPHIDLDQPYYLKTMEETFTINDKLFFLSGDYVCPLYSQCYLMFNYDAWEENKLPDPYQLVRDNKWTFDKYMEIIKGTYRDLNGNGEADEPDFYGATGLPVTMAYNFSHGGGQSFRLTDDGYEFPVTEETNISLLEKLVANMNNPDIYLKYANSTVYKQSFFEGRCLTFMSGSSITTLRDTTFHAGILPFPKYSESQKQYYCELAGGLCAVPITITDAERTGAVIEALYSASARTIKDAYFEQYVEQKALQDEGSVEMLQIIVDNGVYDFTRYIDPSGQIGSNKIFTDLMVAGSTDVVSKWASLKESVEKSFEEFFAGLE